LQRAFPLDIPMVPSFVLAVSNDGERLACGGFSSGETIHFGGVEFIVDHFGDLSLTPRGSDSDATPMGAQPTMGHYPYCGP
jgi:hypothetical protein